MKNKIPEYAKGEWFQAENTGVICVDKHTIKQKQGYMVADIARDENDIILSITNRNYVVDLVTTAVNQCQKVNPENPLVVAENITAMVKMLNELTKHVDLSHPVYDLLNKIEGK